MSNIEQTLSIIKPDAVERNLDNEIKEIFKNNGFKIVDEKKIQIEKVEAEKVIPGTWSCKSLETSICLSSRASAVKADTAIGTDWRLCSVLCAVTITSSIVDWAKAVADKINDPTIAMLIFRNLLI